MNFVTETKAQDTHWQIKSHLALSADSRTTTAAKNLPRHRQFVLGNTGVQLGANENTLSGKLEHLWRSTPGWTAGTAPTVGASKSSTVQY